MVRTTFALLILAVALVSSARSADLPPIEVNVVLGTTGLNAFNGKEQLETVVTAVDLVNRQGGVRGRQLKIVSSDDESNPQLAVQLLSQLAARNVPFVLGPGLTGTCQAALSIVEKSGPLMMCASPGLVAPPGSYGIAAGPTVDDAMIVLMRYFRERGLTRIAVIASTDASGQSYVHGIQLAQTLPENKNVQMVAFERMNPADVSVAAQVSRVKASDPQAVFTLATGTPWGTIMRALNDAGITVPIGGGHGNINYTQLKQYQSFLPREVYFPGIIALVPGAVASGPVKSAQDVYFGALSRAGLQPDLPINLLWDPTMILVSALRKLGPDAGAQQLRDYVVGLRGWVGTDGVYDFRTSPQRGVGASSIVIDRYDNETQTFTPVSKPAGFLK